MYYYIDYKQRKSLLNNHDHMFISKVNTWAMLGRLRRKIWPKLQGGAGGMGESTFAEKSILSGRLMCDTYLAAIEYETFFK